MDSEQSQAQQEDKSRGLRRGNAPDITMYAQRHADIRLAQGFTLDQMASEYRALRASVLRRWADEENSGSHHVRVVVRCLLRGQGMP